MTRKFNNLYYISKVSFLFARYSCAPRKCTFFLDAMNLIDFVTLLPFYISIILEELQDFEIIGKAGKILRLLKVLLNQESEPPRTNQSEMYSVSSISNNHVFIYNSTILKLTE